MTGDTIREAQENFANTIAQDPANARVKNSPATALLQHDLKVRVAGPRGQSRTAQQGERGAVLELVSPERPAAGSR